MSLAQHRPQGTGNPTKDEEIKAEEMKAEGENVASSGSRGNLVWQEHKKQRWRAKDEELKQTKESQILATHSFPFKEFEFQEF